MRITTFFFFFFHLGADERNVNSQRLKGNIPLDLKNLKGNGEISSICHFDSNLLISFFFQCIHFPPIDDVALYESLRDYALTEERLIESNYPVQHPEKFGSAVLFADNKKANADRE